MVTIKFSNKAVYTFIAVFILIVSIGISYALAPNPGHTTSQIEDLDSIISNLCKTDGTDCPAYIKCSWTGWEGDTSVNCGSGDYCSSNGFQLKCDTGTLEYQSVCIKCSVQG